MTNIREGHIGPLQTLDHAVSHLPPDKQKLAKHHHSMANAAAMRSNVKEAEKHFKEFKKIVGESVQEEWREGPPKAGESKGKIVKLNDGDMGKVAHEAGADLAVHVHGRNGISLKRIPRHQVHAHHISEAIYTDQASWEEDMREHGAKTFDRDAHRILAKKEDGSILGAWSVSDRHGITGLGVNVQAESVVQESSKKSVKQARGRTATGQKANVIDTEPKLDFRKLRKQNRGL